MYLREFFVENVGPIDLIHIVPEFLEGKPKPIVFVGSNGSGKTNLLSLFGDALIEIAAEHFLDAVANNNALQRPWFRIVGPTTVRVGAKGGFAILRFDHDGKAIHFSEKARQVDPADVAKRVPETLAAIVASWPKEDTKITDCGGEKAKEIFDRGAYLFFPASRAEAPDWLNSESVRKADFNTSHRFAKRLDKPIFVESSIEELRQWILSVATESRVDFTMAKDASGGEIPMVTGSSIPKALRYKALWADVVEIFRTVVDDRLAVIGIASHVPGRVGFAKSGSALPLDALSAAQITLLNVFCSILRYSNDSNVVRTSAEIEGICVIDEIDAHVHLDLQFRALPSLIRMFPKIQFLVSTHSPLFLLGVEKSFGSEGYQAIELPSGSRIAAEEFVEFERAFRHFSNSRAFRDRLAGDVSKPGKLLVFVEGETDPQYLIRAAEMLGHSDFAELVEVRWIGSKDGAGQGFNTGKGALNSAFNLFRAQPHLVQRRTMLLYDNDAGKQDLDDGLLHVRGLPSNPENKKIKNGIENLLPEALISDEVYSIKQVTKDNGDLNTLKSIDKSKLCSKICAECDAGAFLRFRTTIDAIVALATAV